MGPDEEQNCADEQDRSIGPLVPDPGSLFGAGGPSRSSEPRECEGDPEPDKDGFKAHRVPLCYRIPPGIRRATGPDPKHFSTPTATLSFKGHLSSFGALEFGAGKWQCTRKRASARVDFLNEGSRFHGYRDRRLKPARRLFHHTS
jgi:hypothetical protein